jgi:hypothetical protein
MPKRLKIAAPMLALGVLSRIPLAVWSATPTYEARVDRVLAAMERAASGVTFSPSQPR